MWSQHLFSLAATASAVYALDNGVSKLPAMGYDTFNGFVCDYDANSTLAQAKAMKDHGLVDAGYNLFILDDCYTLKERNASGYMVPDPKRFPQGLTVLNKQMNAYGVNLAAYGDLGYRTCADYVSAERKCFSIWQCWVSDLTCSRARGAMRCKTWSRGTRGG